MSAKTLQADSGGRSHLGVAQDANELALRHGIHLAGICGNVWPANDSSIKARLENEVLETAFLFAYHARRVLDFDKKVHGLREFPKIAINDLWKLDIEKPLKRPHLRTALNKLIHSDHAVVISWSHGNQRFTSLGDRYISHIEMKADGEGPFYVCPYGMVYAFLSREEHYQKGE